MLDAQRIEEAEKSVRRYFQDGLLKREIARVEILSILLRNSRDSLEIAEFLLANKKSNLWIIVTSYYSMFYIANAVLYKKGIRVGEKIAHKVTADALIVYIRHQLQNSLIESYEEIQQQALPGLKADSLLEAFDLERQKRNHVQYEMKEAEIHSKARTFLQRSKEILFEL